MMEQVANIIVIVAMVLFIIVQVHDIIRTHRFYKRMELQHQAFIESLKGGGDNDIKR